MPEPPPIHYTKTSDGVGIAFYALGEGLPLVVMPPLATTHLKLEWGIPEYVHWYQALAEKRKLVRYDMRGSGLSDRDVTDFSLDAHARDLAAVVDRCGLERFALFAIAHGGPPAIDYAVRNPGRVSHLILWCSYARGADWIQAAQIQALRSLVDKDWPLFTQTVAHAVLGWPEGGGTHRFASLMREGVPPETVQRLFAATPAFDVFDRLAQVQAPTLVLHRRQVLSPDVSVATALAAGIPDSQLVLLEGESLAPFLGETESVLSAIDNFLSVGASSAPSAEAKKPSSLRTVLFSDLVGHTEMIRRLGDEAGRAVLRDHERITRDVLRKHGGDEVKTMGDGFMASFGSVTRAVECAVALQQSVATYNESSPEPLHVRVGLNAGEPIAEEGDLFGSMVIMASRIAAKAGAGEILIPEPVRHLLSGKSFLFSDRGDVALKGFEDPVRLYEVRWRSGG